MPKIVPNLWFDGDAEEAAGFYVSLFPNSRITNVLRHTAAGPGPEGSVLTVDFELDGQRFTGINGGPQFTFDEAVSFLIEVADQDELDRYWDALTADGGEESQCGWLKDRFGLSWQVVPEGWESMFAGDPEAAARTTEAMFTMTRLDIAALRTAYDG